MLKSSFLGSPAWWVLNKSHVRSLSAWPSFPLAPRLQTGFLWRGGGLFSHVLTECPLWFPAPHPGLLTPRWGVSAVLKGLKWTPQCRLGMRVLRRLFVSPVFSCPHTTQQQAQRGEGDCPGSHSKIRSERAQASGMFRGLPGRQVGGKKAQPSVPSLLLWRLENVPPHSNLGAELKATAKGWESSKWLS